MPTIDMAATGENIRKLMKERGVTVRDVQRACGFTTGNTVYKWVHGTAMPAIDSLVVLAHLCNVTIDEIIITTRRGENMFCA